MIRNNFNNTAWLPLLFVILPVMGLVWWAHASEFSIPRVENVLNQSTTTAQLPNPSQFDQNDQKTNWVPTTLPDKQCKTTWEICYDHYQTTFDRSDRGPQSDVGIFLPEFTGSVRVYINEQQLIEYGRIRQTAENLMFQPSYTDIPHSYLRHGTNTVSFTITNRQRVFHRLSPFYVGAAEELSAYASPIRWLMYESLILSIGIFATITLFTILLFRVSDPDPIYLWLAAVTFCAGLRNSYFLISAPSYEGLRTALYFFGTNLEMIALAGFVGQLLHPDKNRFYLFAVGITIAAVIYCLWQISIDPMLGGFFANALTRNMFLLSSLFVVYGMFLYLRQHWSTASAWILAFLVGSFALTLSDVVPLVVWQKPSEIQLAGIAPVLLVFAFCIIVAQRFQTATAAAHNAKLEQVQAVNSERNRIKRDMHDGVSAQMARLLMLVRRKSPEIAPHMESSLEDLRTIMDSLDTAVQGDLKDALENCRTRLQKWLGLHGLESQWTFTDIGPGNSVAPLWEACLFRCVQELVNNCLRHATATKIDLHFTLEGSVLRADVCDNGTGFETAQINDGSGLQGIEKRLRDYKGGLSIHNSKDGGAQIRFSLPLLATSP